MSLLFICCCLLFKQTPRLICLHASANYNNIWQDPKLTLLMKMCLHYGNGVSEIIGNWCFTAPYRRWHVSDGHLVDRFPIATLALRSLIPKETPNISSCLVRISSFCCQLQSSVFAVRQTLPSPSSRWTNTFQQTIMSFCWSHKQTG